MGYFNLVAHDLTPQEKGTKKWAVNGKCKVKDKRDQIQIHDMEKKQKKEEGGKKTN